MVNDLAATPMQYLLISQNYPQNLHPFQNHITYAKKEQDHKDTKETN